MAPKLERGQTAEAVAASKEELSEFITPVRRLVTIQCVAYVCIVGALFYTSFFLTKKCPEWSRWFFVSGCIILASWCLFAIIGYEFFSIATKDNRLDHVLKSKVYQDQNRAEEAQAETRALKEEVENDPEVKGKLMTACGAYICLFFMGCGNFCWFIAGVVMFFTNVKPNCQNASWYFVYYLCFGCCWGCFIQIIRIFCISTPQPHALQPPVRPAAYGAV